MRNLCCLVAFVFAALDTTASATQTLDGKTFAGEVKMEGDKKGDPDNFIFKEGKFRSTSCDQYGYTEAPYIITTEGNKTLFTATTKNDKGATIDWKGSFIGPQSDELVGTSVMTAADGKKTKMLFHGTLKH